MISGIGICISVISGGNFFSAHILALFLVIFSERLIMSNVDNSNIIAGLASFFIPGLGQLLQQRYLAALIYFGFSIVCWFFFMGWIISIISCISAVRYRF